MTILLGVWFYGAFWTAMAAARTTRWGDPLEMVMFALATLLWPLFWPWVILMAVTGKLK